MRNSIYYISPESMEEHILESVVYPDCDHDLYWSDNWDPDFYISLARAGFISVCRKDEEYGAMLLPEIQLSYAVLDWKNLTCSRKVKKLVKSGFLKENRVTVTVSGSTAEVVSGINRSYGTRSWLIKEYSDMLNRTESLASDKFSLHAIELRTGEDRVLVGGELGYTTGAVYTSLTGFLDREHPLHNNLGKVQLLTLAQLLIKNGYAFWNLGHPHMQYKLDMGSAVLPRNEFLQRWKEGRGDRPAVSLGSLTGKEFQCSELLSPLL